MIIAEQRVLEAIEPLVMTIKNKLYNEETNAFPDFALTDDFVSLIWSENEEDKTDRNSWIDYSKFIALKKASEVVSGCNSFYIAWAFRELGDNNKPKTRTVIELPFEWNMVRSYESELDYQINQFYVFDDSLTWFLHIDDSVLLAGNKQFMSNFVKSIGGADVANKMFDIYLDEVNSQDTRDWVDLIKTRFVSNA
jgi:hypothetical protein